MLRARRSASTVVLLAFAGCGVLSNKHRASMLLAEASEFAEAQDPASAAASAQAARDLSPDFASAYLAAWRSLIAADRETDGLAELDLALKAAPDHPFAIHAIDLMAQRDLGQGNLDAALKRISDANQAIGGHPALLERKAQILLSQGDAAQALTAMRQLESMVSMDLLTPDWAIDLTVFHAQILARLDRIGEAVALVLPYAHVAEDDEARRPQVAPLLSQALMRHENQPGLLAVLAGLHETLPNSRYLKYHLGRALASDGKHAEALDLFDSFVTDTDAEGQFLRSYVLAQMGRVEEAVKALETALAAAPQDKRPMLLASLALLHARLGNDDLAATEYSQALDLDPGDLRALSGLLDLERADPAVVDTATVDHRIENALAVTRDPALRRQLEEQLQKRRP